MRELILLRGLPGSGKSTLAAVLAGQGAKAVFSVDDYFTDDEGKYHFEFEQNHLAYKQCENLTESAMQANEVRIFVHNTFVYDWEMAPYFDLAAKYRYRIHVVTVENRHGGENVHGVSREQIEKMATKYSVLLFYTICFCMIEEFVFVKDVIWNFINLHHEHTLLNLINQINGLS